MADTFNEAEYYESYRRIRNRFRKYPPLNLLDSCIKYLHQPVKDKLEHVKKHPWCVLLLIKWLMLDKESWLPKDNRILTTTEFVEILNMTRELASKTRSPEHHDNVILFIRNIAYQQFLYQIDLNVAGLIRQQLLFSALDENHTFKKQFKTLTNLDIQRFLELSLVTLINFIKEEHSLSENWFSSIEKEYPKDEIAHFLKTISIDIAGLKSELLKSDKKKRSSNEYYEQTPLIRFPLLRINNNYICIDRNILFRSLDHFVYDTLRSWNAERFMSQFGDIFERYLENSISYTGLNYATEKELQTILGRHEKCVDFLIQENDVNIFIEAKAVEMSYQGKVTHLADIVKDKVEQSVLKAIAQAHDVVNKLHSQHPTHKIIRPQKTNYLLVVTYKELYLGNGVNFYEVIAKNKLDQILSKYSPALRIPFENMYFITIEEFDLFSKHIKDKKISLVEGIEKAKKEDSNIHSRKFDFFLHLMDWGAKNDPDFIKAAYLKIFSKLENILKP